eukprot:m.393510 g.393510  ORF g.393510 m.393510 type:complete len:225 (-) comp56356_c0_seq56:381-1055(-)
MTSTLSSSRLQSSSVRHALLPRIRFSSMFKRGSTSSLSSPISIGRQKRQRARPTRASLIYSHIAEQYLPGFSLCRTLRDLSFATCRSLAEHLLRMVTSRSVARVNLNGLRSFLRNIQACEAYANACPYMQQGDATLKGLLIGVRQLVELFIYWDWQTYCESNGKEYRSVPPLVAFGLLERLEESLLHKKPSSLKAEEKKRQKDVDLLMKKLQSMHLASQLESRQ